MTITQYRKAVPKTFHQAMDLAEARKIDRWQIRALKDYAWEMKWIPKRSK